MNYEALKHDYNLDKEKALANFSEAYAAGDISRNDISLVGLFESFVENGAEWLRETSIRRKSGRPVTLLEAGDAVSLSDFANITGQIVFSEIKQGLENPEFLYPQLVDSRQTPFPYGERIPGVGKVGDRQTEVGEGQPYPRAGVNEEYVDVGATIKRGLIVDVTREAVEFDQTGKVLDEASNLGYSHGVELEKRTLDVVFGITNSYKRNGVATNTYLTSGAYINDTASGNALTDWTSIQAQELLFDAITDPNTGEPVVLRAATLIVPTALKRTAQRIRTATGIRFGDGASNTTATYSPNPMDQGMYGQPSFTIASNAYVKARTSSASKWFFGDPKKAFRRYYNWDREITFAADNNVAKFERDVWSRAKLSTRDVVAIIEPRFMSRSNA